MTEYCPRCGTVMKLYDLDPKQTLPNEVSITEFWGCSKCHNDKVRGWAFVFSEDGDYYIFLDSEWVYYEGKTHSIKVRFT